MPISLSGRNFLKLLDYTPDEIRYLLRLSEQFKSLKLAGTPHRYLEGKNIVLLFEKTSTRTRCAFEVAGMDLGMGVTYLDPGSSQMGAKESIADTAQVLGRMYDGIEYRGFEQGAVEILAANAGIPVYNGLTDSWHPTQMLADQLTMLEYSGKPLSETSWAFVGDVRNNMGNSNLISAAMVGADIRLIAPRQLQTSGEVRAQAESIAAETGARITITDDIAEGVAGVDFLHTDVWLSLGEPKELWAERIALLKPYQVNAAMIAATGNPQVRFMHCLPAFHDRDTALGEEIYQETGLDALEVTDEVFESEASIVFDQAENRMHTIKALLVATLAG